MRITADTNLLIRATTNDHPEQAEHARIVLAAAELVVIPITVLCEFAWVLGRGYRYSRSQMETAIRRYLVAETVVTDRAAAEDGLRLLAAGGDFADGVVAHQGRVGGGPVFASFDQTALALLGQLGHAVLCPG